MTSETSTDLVLAERRGPVLVLTGAGRGFCAGADFDLLEDATGDEPSRSIVERPRPRNRPMQLRKPPTSPPTARRPRRRSSKPRSSTALEKRPPDFPPLA